MKEQDCLRRFLFEELGVRGEWVRLQQSWQDSKQHQSISPCVQEHLGQALAATVLMSAIIKFEGSLILQAQGDGDLKTLVAQSTHSRKIRGLARANPAIKQESLTKMMGNGRLVITVEPDQGEPYQGIVSLEGNNLADMITNYFMQSEQLQTKVWLFADKNQAVGLFLQELPAHKSFLADWERISALAETITKNEMMDLDSEEMLYRLFNEEKVRLFTPEPVQFECSCSREKVEKTLFSLGRNELESILQERERIEVDCEFCGNKNSFDAVDVEKLLSHNSIETNSKTHH